MKFWKLVTIALVFTLFSCGGGDTGSSGDNTTISQDSINVSNTLYENNPSFKPGQFVIIESIEPFADGETLNATDSHGNSITVTGLPDGTAILILPFNIDVGEYVIQVARGTSTTSLTLDITSVTLPLNPEIYLSDIIDQMKAQINAMLIEQGASPDPLLTTLLNDLEEIDLSQLSDDEVSRIANQLYVNANAFFNVTNNANLAKPQLAIMGSPMLSRSSSECIASKILLSADIVLFAVLAGVTAVDPDPVTKVLFFGTALLAANNLITGFVDYFDNCPGTVLSSFVRDLGAKLARTPPKDGVSNVIYAAKVNDSAPINFYDGDTKAINLSVSETPNEELSGMLWIFKSAVNSISFLIPDSLLSSVNNLGNNIEKDLTDKITLEPINNTSVVCSGDKAAYKCQFPDDGLEHTEAVNFTITINHPDYEDTFIQNATLSPHGVPVINDQAFNVTIGPGNVNRIEIKVIEDPNSPNYDLTKVIEYEVVTRPVWGVILNEFNEPGVIDYAADIIDGMPNSEQFTVRVRNKYGWSGTAIITLNFSDECIENPEEFFSGLWTLQLTPRASGPSIETYDLNLTQDGIIINPHPEVSAFIGGFWVYSCTKYSSSGRYGQVFFEFGFAGRTYPINSNSPESLLQEYREPCTGTEYCGGYIIDALR